jgi:hypothetical protein
MFSIVRSLVVYCRATRCYSVLKRARLNVGRESRGDEEDVIIRLVTNE